MSIIAGIYARRPGADIPPAASKELTALLSRNPDDRIDTFCRPGCFLAKLDIGAYASPAFGQLPGGSAAVAAGHPYLEGLPEPRSPHARRLAECGETQDWSVLRQAQGSFAAACYNPAGHVLTLITDKVGVRGVFFWSGDDYVIFASALRVLAGLSAVPKRLDIRGALEAAAFGFPIADRTGYSGIFRLAAGEMACWTPQGHSRSQYWRWEEHVRPSSLSEPEQLREVYESFLRAVRRRTGTDSGAISCLSGGLDSRVVVAAVRNSGVNVWTCNFSLPGTRDRVFAERFATAAGTYHTLGQWKLGAPFLLSLADHLESAPRPPFSIDRPRLIWTGDGGSVGFGHVHLEPSVVELLEAGDRSGAVAAYLKFNGCRLPHRLFVSRVRKAAAGMADQSVAAQLGALRAGDEVRKFHLYLLLNDQRWHMFSVYEDIDQHRLEPHLPFFDGGFLEAVLGVPVQWCLYHRFYNKWLSEFPPAAASVPWQSYPGHEPCPVPEPPGLAYQWSAEYGKEFTRQTRKRVLSTARRVLEDFPASLMSRSRFRAAAFAHRLGLRNYAYVVAAASSLQRFWKSSGGQVDWDTLPNGGLTSGTHGGGLKTRGTGTPPR